MRLSVITINYNNKEGLEKTVLSVIQQTYTNFEYIIIDGNSTDGSKLVIEKYANNIHKWVSERDKGIYDAMNKGIAKASGVYCLFINSGDVLTQNKVLAQMMDNVFNEDIIYGDLKINRGNGQIQNGYSPNKIGLIRLYRDTLWHPVSFIKKELFEKFGMYNLDYKIVADYEFFVKVIIAKKISMRHLPVFVAEFDTSGLSMDLSKLQDQKKERMKVQENYFPRFILKIFRAYSKIKNP
jgi:glycosyltransferase involved in cell wall biosynthesis